MEKVAQNVFVNISSRGCNHSFVVTSEGPVMIDTPMMPDDAEKWKAELSRFGGPRYIINTEPHVDHVSGNFFFSAPVIAHEGVRKALLESSPAQYAEMVKRSDPGIEVPAGYRFRPPDITLSERLTLYLGKHTFQLINLPGHSPYQVPVFVPEEGVIFTSDNVTHNVPPFMHQALPEQWVESLKKLKGLDADKLVPGHGPVADKGYLDTMIETVQGAIDAVKGALNKGLTLEEAQRTVVLFPRFPMNERTLGVQKMSIARLYEVLKTR